MWIIFLQALRYRPFLQYTHFRTLGQRKYLSGSNTQVTPRSPSRGETGETQSMQPRRACQTPGPVPALMPGGNRGSRAFPTPTISSVACESRLWLVDSRASIEKTFKLCANGHARPDSTSFGQT